MSRFRFIHAADLHLDSPFHGIGERMPERVRRQIKESTFRAFDRLIKLCIDQQADFLCIAGDVYDLADRSLRAQAHFQRGLRILQQHGINAYVIHGNHDPANGKAASLEWPGNVHVFSPHRVESVAHYIEGKEVARIYGRSYPDAKFSERIIADYRREADSPFAIGLLHTNLDGNVAHDNYAPCTRRELEEKGFDYWALGHIHQGEIIRQREPAIVYSGNIQGRHAKETGAKGCYLVEVDGGQISNVSFLETDDVRWLAGEVDVTGAETMQQVIDRTEEMLATLKEEAGNRPVITRLALTGTTIMHARLKPPDELREWLESFLQEELTEDEQWLWVESLKVNTRPFASLESLKEGKGFLADFLRISEQLCNHPSELTEIRDNLLRPLFITHKEGKKHLASLTDAELLALIGEAEDLALQLFYSEEDEG